MKFQNVIQYTWHIYNTHSRASCSDSVNLLTRTPRIVSVPKLTISSQFQVYSSKTERANQRINFLTCRYISIQFRKVRSLVMVRNLSCPAQVGWNTYVTPFLPSLSFSVFVHSSIPSDIIQHHVSFSISLSQAAFLLSAPISQRAGTVGHPLECLLPWHCQPLRVALATSR